MKNLKAIKTIAISISCALITGIDSIAIAEIKFPEIRLNNKESANKKIDSTNKNKKKTKSVIEIKESDENTEAYFYKKGREAYLTYTIKGYREAIKQYDLGLKLNRNNALLRAAKSEALSLLSRDLSEISNSIEAVNSEMQAFENAYISADLDPNLPEAHRALSMIYLVKENFKEGRKSASKSISLNPDDAESHLLLWLNSPDRDKMMKASIYSNYYTALDINSEELEKSLELNDKNALAYLELGEVYSALGKFNKAKEYYDMVLELSPENIKAMNLLGFVYIELSQLDNAFEIFDKVLELEDNNSEAIHGLGIATLKNKDNLKALEYFTKACEQDYLDACDMKSNLELRRWQNRPWNRNRRRGGTPNFSNLSF